jgi:hypothetical protein
VVSEEMNPFVKWGIVVNVSEAISLMLSMDTCRYVFRFQRYMAGAQKEMNIYLHVIYSETNPGETLGYYASGDLQLTAKSL